MSNDDKKNGKSDSNTSIEQSPDFEELKKRILQARARRASRQYEEFEGFEKLEEAEEFEELEETEGFEELEGFEGAKEPQRMSVLSFVLSDEPVATRFRRVTLRFLCQAGMVYLDAVTREQALKDDPDIN